MRFQAAPAELLRFRQIALLLAQPGEFEKRDPILRLRDDLLEAGANGAALDEIDAAVAEQLVELERRGLEAPFPEPRSTSEFSG